MHRIKKVLFFLHATNSIVAVAGALLTLGFCAHYQFENSFKYGVLTFCLIFSVYFFQRMIDHVGFSEQERTVWGNKTWFGIGVSAVLLLIGFALGLSLLQYSTVQITLIILFTLICGWYVVPLFGTKLREIAGLKLILIAATWTYTCFVFPYLNHFKVVNPELIAISFLLLAYISAVVLPFDIRDRSIDLLKQSTLPQVIGIQLSKLVGFILLTVFAVGIYLLQIIEPTNVLFAGSVLIQMVLLAFATDQRPFYYFLLIDFSIGLLGLSFFY